MFRVGNFDVSFQNKALSKKWPRNLDYYVKKYKFEIPTKEKLGT